MHKSSPAWTALGKNKEKLPEKVPGPGAYEPQFTLQEFSPRWSSPKSQKLNFLAPKTPGPGTYEQNPLNSSTRITRFGRSEKIKDMSKTDSPGPGAYNIIPQPSGPQFTLIESRREIKPNGVPGPGTYIVPEDQKYRLPAFSVPKAKKLEKFLDTPGPGNYSLSPIKDGPKWKLGTEPKSAASSFLSPGPGTYDCRDKPFSPSFSMTAKPCGFNKNPAPGPGAYTPKSSKKNLVFSIGQAEKLNFKPNPAPGPGAYSPSPPKSQCTFFGTSVRKVDTFNTETPGPGQYEPRPSQSSPKFTLSGKFLPKFPEIPGPGAYNPLDIFKKNLCTKIGKEKRLKFSPNKNPGPGTYESSRKPDGPQWGFTRSDKSPSPKNQIPGPGDYFIPSTIPNIASYIKLK